MMKQLSVAELAAARVFVQRRGVQVPLGSDRRRAAKVALNVAAR